MSIEFARPMKTVATGIAAAAFLFAQQAAADNLGITRFAVRNCTHADVLICTYNKDDSLLKIPYDANKIQPGEKKRASCGSANRCKAFSLISANDVKKVITSNEELAVLSGSAATGGMTVGLGAGIAFIKIGEALGANFLTLDSMIVPMFVGAAVGAAVAGGGFIGVVKTINVAKAGETCEQALKDSRKLISEMDDAKVRQGARDALKRTLGGSWPKYKNYSLVTQANGVPVLVEGDKC